MGRNVLPIITVLEAGVSERSMIVPRGPVDEAHDTPPAHRLAGRRNYSEASMIVARATLRAAALLMLLAVDRLQGAQETLAAPRMAETAARLHAIEPAEGDTDISPAVSELLTRFKHQLRDTVVDAVASEAVDASASLLQQSILHALRSEGIRLDAEWGGYGSIESIEVERPKSPSGLLVITTELSIPCGSDTSLYVFEAGKLILAREAKPYDTVSGAQGSFEWRLSPPDPDGSWFVVTANINPWCSSNWQSLRYEALRPGPSPDSPRVLVSDESTIFLSDGYELSIDRGSFTLNFIAGQTLDVGILTREHVIRVRIDGDRAQRIEPIATTPQGFVDEWLRAPWGEISRWSDPALESLHDEIATALSWEERKKDHFSSSLAPTVTCAGSREWIVELDLEPDSDTDLEQDSKPCTESDAESDKSPESLWWYFDVVATDGGFRMLAISDDIPLDCGVVAVPNGSEPGRR
jgi:hypothetical protein